MANYSRFQSGSLLSFTLPLKEEERRPVASIDSKVFRDYGTACERM